jgi:hypothetical protein
MAAHRVALPESLALLPEPRVPDPEPRIPSSHHRARRLFFNRDWRSLRGFLFGFEISRVTLPTRRTSHLPDFGFSSAMLTPQRPKPC